MNSPSEPPPTDLPPPPAPVARDANPWHWPQPASERPGSRRTKAPNPKLAQLQRLREAAANASPSPSPSPSPAAAVPRAPSTARQRKREGRGGLAAIVPFGMFLVAMGIVASGALDALRAGAGLGALIPLLVIALIFGLGALRRARRGERK